MYCIPLSLLVTILFGGVDLSMMEFGFYCAVLTLIVFFPIMNIIDILFSWWSKKDQRNSNVSSNSGANEESEQHCYENPNPSWTRENNSSIEILPTMCDGIFTISVDDINTDNSIRMPIRS